MLPVPEASVPAVEICSDRSVAGITEEEQVIFIFWWTIHFIWGSCSPQMHNIFLYETLQMRIMPMHLCVFELWTFSNMCKCLRKLSERYLSLLERLCSSPERWLSACFPPQGHYWPHQPLMWSAWWSSSPCDSQEQPAEGERRQTTCKTKISHQSRPVYWNLMCAVAELVPFPQWSLFVVQKVQWGSFWCLGERKMDTNSIKRWINRNIVSLQYYFSDLCIDYKIFFNILWLLCKTLHGLGSNSPTLAMFKSKT